MADAVKITWDALPVEEVSSHIGRKLVYSDAQMIAQVFLKDGAVIPAHEHINEQFSYVVSGCLRMWLGEHADNPSDVFVDVNAGEVLMIPAMLRHRGIAIGETFDLDIFNPPRADWIAKEDAYLRESK